MKGWLAVALAAAILAPGVASAQEPSLAEAAAREKARRKAMQKEKGAGKTFTDEDLKSAAGDKGTVSTPTATETEAPRAAAPRAAPRSGRGQGGGSSEFGEAAEDPPERADEGRVPAGSSAETWARRAEALRDKIGAAEARIPVLEQRIGELRLDMAPNSPDALDPNRLQKREVEINRLRGEVDAARAEAASLKEAYARLEEEARAAGIPASVLEGRD